MRKALTILFTAFYLSGSMFLPMGDFSSLVDMPGMYRHCRDTEDPDLNVFEFFTEHVSPIGALIEGTDHDDDDEAGDKPHAPVSYHFQQQISFIVYPASAVEKKPEPSILPEFPPVSDDVYLSSYASSILRPPIC